MKTRLTAVLAAAAILLVAFAAVASAATSTGKIHKFKYNAATNTGKLTILKGKKVKKSFALSLETLCGVSYGQSGDEIPCKTLGAKKYKGKKVRVTTGKNEAGKKVTQVISVDMARR